MKIVLSNQEVMGALQAWVATNLPMFGNSPLAFVPSLARDSQRTITVELLIGEEATEYQNSLKAPVQAPAEPVTRTRKPKGDPLLTAPVEAVEEEAEELVEAEEEEEVEAVSADADQPVDDEEEEEVEIPNRRPALRTRRTTKSAE